MDAVDAAFQAVPRALFLPRADVDRADYDGPIAIGRGQTNSQPRTVAAMLRLLEVRTGDHVLDIGAGSGWSTALLAHLTGPTGIVVGLELEPELARWGAQNLASTGMPWASISPAVPGVLGTPGDGPYDRILVSAEARQLPQPLVELLADDGRLVVPVRGTMTLAVRQGQALTTTHHGHYRFVPLR
ncbi:protein-L-isoaspartate carboxylmethyltransferase [Humibacillus sp. DSM 29435]|uniref:protein-L-isoaspartate O-methyltransferase family protein n=1 Tax=Humibacillus sp. DSM 29435 TaxID=1869167 RepID=UPI0008729020|nr:protein-L-isoaspartate O-methyltransferase [Humibacillus sp. DSM 29435]OFE16352.1 protein-L-isoaspartate carboxylmethyltransferase [Humibacillus sp. DSM 29435]